MIYQWYYFLLYLTGDLGVVGFLWELIRAKERLQIMKAILMAEESFDEAVKGVDGILHTASPPVIVPYDDNIQAKLLIIWRSTNFQPKFSYTKNC